MMQKTTHAQGLWRFLKGQRKLWLILGIALFGILLLAVGSAEGKTDADADERDFTPQSEAMQAYETALEKELEALCEAAAGVSDCTVMVTLANGYTTAYATDEKGAPATTGNGSNEQALFASITPPAIAGVGVVCRGGRDPQVQAMLTNLISTTLGISTARVYIAGK